MTITEEIALTDHCPLRQVVNIDSWGLLFPYISDRSSCWCAFVSGTSISLPCLIIPELLLFAGMTIGALIQIIKNVVNWHIERLLLLIILKSSLRIASSTKQTLASFMSWMTWSFEHACCRSVIKKHFVHISVVSNALELWSCQFGIDTASSLEMIWMINLLKHTSATCLHDLLWSCRRVLLS